MLKLLGDNALSPKLVDEAMPDEAAIAALAQRPKWDIAQS
jgi:hypothetical protein